MICQILAIMLSVAVVLSAVYASGDQEPGPSQWPEIHSPRTARTVSEV